MHRHGPASKTKYDYAKIIVNVIASYQLKNKTRAENLQKKNKLLLAQ